LPRDGETYVDLVLMIGDKQFDRLAQHGTAEILDRHPRALRSAWSRQISIGTRLVVENANPEGFICTRGRGSGGKRQEEKEGESSPKHSARPRGDGDTLPQ
jgi:hypothetical protein